MSAKKKFNPKVNSNTGKKARNGNSTVPQAISRAVQLVQGLKARKLSEPAFRSHFENFTSIPLNDILIRDRETDPEVVSNVAQSVKTLGLRTPISVRALSTGFELIAGAHRVEAVRSLGWNTIPCLITHDDNVRARLWSISENRDRKELRAIDRANLAIEYRTLMNLGVQVARPSGQPHDAGISSLARSMGVTREEARRSLTIGTLSDGVKAAAIESQLDDNQAALLEVAKEKTVESQKKKIAEIKVRKSRRSTPKHQSSQPDMPSIPDFLDRSEAATASRNDADFRSLVTAWQAANELRAAWADASAERRRHFAVEVLGFSEVRS